MVTPVHTVTVMPLETDVAAHDAQLRAALAGAGLPIGPNDLLIASHALALEATLVSADAECQCMPGLKLENGYD